MARSVGIYISRTNVDLVELDTGFKGLKVINSIRVPIALPTPDVSSKSPVADALREAVSKAKLKNLPVSAVIPSQDVLIRYFQMPLLPIRERHKAIIFEAKKYIPFKLEEVASGYCIAEIQKKPVQDNMDVVFAAIKKDTLNQYISYFEQAGLKLKTVEPAALSLLRWYKFNSFAEDHQSVALLELEPNNPSLTLSVIKRNIPYFVREIGLSKPLVLEKEASLDKGMVERLVSEMHISFEYYKKWFQGEKIDKIILFSAAEALPSLLEVLAKEVDIPLESGALRKGIKTRGYLSSDLYLATGAALRDKVKSKVKLNLYHLPKINWFEGKKGTQKAVALEAVAAFLFLSVLNLIVSGPVKFNQAQLRNLISNRPHLEEDIDINSPNALKEAKDNLLKKQNTLNELLKNKFYWTPRLAALAISVPGGVWITDVRFNKKRETDLASAKYNLLIKGKALSPSEGAGEEAGNKLVENLLKDRYFNNIFKELSVSSVETQQIGDNRIVTFEISSTEVGFKPPRRR